MNDALHEQRKESILRSLAIIGFIGAILLIAWLSVKLVNSAPGAFSSLASLAQSLNQPSEDSSSQHVLTIVSNTTLVKAKEPVTVTWNEFDTTGNFSFSYTCTDGVAIDLQNIEGLTSIACNTNYNIGNITSLTFTIDSEKERFADVQYTVSYFGVNDTVARASSVAKVTVINGDVITGLTSTSTSATTTETTTVEEPEKPIEVPVVKPTVPTPIQPTEEVVTKPEPVPEVTYIIPVSNPAGRVDLGVRYLHTGTIAGQTFVPGSIARNSSGAIQFEVWNYGSKTSGDWTFSVSLPNGSTFTSETQTALKPNERATLTIGFPTDNDSTHTFVVIVTEASDEVALNDSFQQPITFR